MTYGTTLVSPDGCHFSRSGSNLRGGDSGPSGRFMVQGDVPAWVPDVLQQLDRLLDLGVNWSGTPSAPIEPRLAVGAVNDVLAAVLPNYDAPVPQLVPCVDGGLQLEWHRGGWDIEVSLSPLGQVWVDASSADLEWDGDFASRREDLRLVLASIS